ncbi:methyltransferase [Nocardia aurantia]|uniref:N,N-dimethyltransferase OxyT n=1 Tax=Nocardia aurantia TaxID=2585199 RepID=A0A7K0DUJ3_9NOCA|nr:methyltransferase [Nocardia aurantia]MQY29248.1 N,N-dimethyltransferase OxyT [Nocardia aurantia]
MSYSGSAAESEVRGGVNLRREKLVMKLFQSRVGGALLRRLADPEEIVRAGTAFTASQVVLTAVEFGLFTELAAGRRSKHELCERLGWHPRAAGPFLDALVDLGLLRRGRSGRYTNSRAAALFLRPAGPNYVGGLLELSGKRLYTLWSGLGDLLRTGIPEAGEERGGNEFFSTLYRDPAALRDFLTGMTGIATGEAMLIAARFPWRRFRTFVDIGCAQGALPVRLALTHPHLTGAGYDLAAVEPIFREYVESYDLADRLLFIPGDMFHEPLPGADVVSFGHILHGYGESVRRDLLAKAYAALPPGGAVLVYDAMIDPRRRDNLLSRLSSLNIMLEMRGGFEATLPECETWLRDAGFVDIRSCHLIGPTSMIHGRKPGPDPATRR